MDKTEIVGASSFITLTVIITYTFLISSLVFVNKVKLALEPLFLIYSGLFVFLFSLFTFFTLNRLLYLRKLK